MKPVKYTLIHAPDTLKLAVKQVQEVKNTTDLVTKRKRATVTSSSIKKSELKGRRFTSSTTAKVVNKRVRPVTVGLWDLGAWLGSLSQIVEGLNRSQKAFAFFEVKAAVPLGIIKQPQRAIPKLEEFLGYELSPDDRATVGNNFFAADYYSFGEFVRKDFKIDYLVGITSSMIADTTVLDAGEKRAAWNLFSTFDEHLILVSSYELREFAVETAQPFELFLATVIVAQILVAKFFPTLGFHADTGCLFDFNEERSTIKNKVLSPAIESSCLARIPPPYDSAALSLLRFIRSLLKESP